MTIKNKSICSAGNESVSEKSLAYCGGRRIAPRFVATRQKLRHERNYTPCFCPARASREAQSDVRLATAQNFQIRSKTKIGRWLLLLQALAIAICLPVQAAAKDDIPAQVMALSHSIFPGGVDAVVASPIDNLFAIQNGTSVIYVSGDGKFAIEGDIVNLETGENLTSDRRDLARKAMLQGLDEQDLIVFAPQKARHTITVFTDVDCGYCRRLHSEVKILNEAGIAVRYVAYPRAGPSSDTYKTMTAVWCAKDRKKAMTDAKAGLPVSSQTCAAPLEKHRALGKQMGVRGTPAIMLEDGTFLAGYVPAARLKNILDKFFPGR